MLHVHGVCSTIPGAKAAATEASTIATSETFTCAYGCTVAVT